MSPIVNPVTRVRVGPARVDTGFWPAVAEQVSDWWVGRGVNPRDAVVLLPYAGLLSALREAFAQRGGWQPRIETPRTLATSLAPASASAPGQISLDVTTDRLSAAALLRAQASGAAWARRDATSFHVAVAALVDTAHALLRASHERAPHSRAAFWSIARDALVPVSGPGASERWLARMALEWAAAADAPAQDLLWQLLPAAWVGVQAGGRDALAEALLAAAHERDTPVLWLDADPPVAVPFDAVARLPPPRRWLCEGLEGEAQASTLAVLEALDAGQTPIALIAQDRLIVRRIRALLERAQVALRDETGWALSTTRSAARLMALVRAADPGATRDTLLDWLKGEPGDATVLERLEAAWRRGSAPDVDALAHWHAAQTTIQTLRFAGRRTLASWLAALAAAAPALLRAFADDAAGRPLLAALRLDGLRPGAAWQAAAESTLLDLAGFTAWVDTALEASTFLPPNASDASVVITPLASAMLRPFAAVVMPGCDNLRLGAASIAPGLLGDALLNSVGLPDARQQSERERIALAHILRAPRVTLLRRRIDDGEPLAASPLVEHAWQARRRLAQPAPDEVAPPLPHRFVAALPLARPAPCAPQALPARLSASAVEALRACPYRFFAQSLLGLREAPELDAALEKRDYGTWLHGVLLRFHAARPGSDAAASDAPRLLAAADAEQGALALDAAQLLPFRAAFESFAGNYLAWLHARDAEGWSYEAGELALRRDAPALEGVVLDGRIDRVDVHAASGTRQLIDYKTGSVQALKDKVAEPLEDTQLAFYAALLADAETAKPVRAIYLALDDRKPPQAIEHPDVAVSAALLVEGLAHDLAQLRSGAGLPALGEGAVCDHCEARGLCRRDHWASEAAA
jgi:ATP-dependent helicase/nuclease subunit B